MDAAILHGAFADPPRASQSTFRTLMAALAEPGTRHPLTALAEPPAPLPPGAGTVLLTLADADTPVHIAPAFGDLARRWAAFHTGAPLADACATALFAILPAPDFEGFPIGTDTYPDRSATLIVPVRFEGPAFTLTGPGIETQRTLRADLGADFAARWAQNRALFPRGVDLILVDGAHVVGLPRTTTFTEQR